MKKKVGIPFLLLVCAILILSGCSKNTNDNQNHSNVLHAENGDLQEKTVSLTKMPNFLDGLSPVIQTAYSVAASVSEELPYIPCYCGCGESAGHKSNLNCFINKINDDGSVVWDDHGTRCGVCMETAMTTAEMKKAGKSLSEIRQTIDTMYKEGYANPTRTPFPKV
ncbi:PCYCGC motif-containing (lipo)protein [Paenibacillus sp. MMO-177]|uniref:PCYCGC motif-containing (lipo)protein n=1 Tax=Paenibacillus sp. MMO-177 TaxID=3081289 RepID=UPI0030167B0C